MPYHRTITNFQNVPNIISFLSRLIYQIYSIQSQSSYRKGAIFQVLKLTIVPLQCSGQIYELTAENLKHSQKPRDETTLNQDQNEDITTSNVVGPGGESDVLSHDENQNEIKNKGLHVIKWLFNDLREPVGKAQPEGLQHDVCGEVVSEETQNYD